jgi:hypothetical protein
VNHVDGVDYAQLERSYRRWWDIHGPARPFHAKLPTGAAGVWPLKLTSPTGRPVDERVGPFCHVEFESEAVEMWGFEVRADRDRFVGRYGGEKL